MDNCVENKNCGNTTTLSYCRSRMEQMIEQLDSSEITITFKQKWRDEFTNDEIHQMIIKYFGSIPLTDLRELLLISEYGENRNLHYHGIIRGKLKDVSQLKSFLNKRFGRTEIKVIKYPQSYVKYMLKEQTEEEIEGSMIYYKYNSEQKAEPKIGAKTAPSRMEHPMNCKTYKHYDISLYFK
ncbi:putative Rep [uncultured virus]|uniref:Putative Rep n=1 Tax=uncultured virus TaxID=340016 RepID=A0A2K9LTG8_9VIRU|nr:putative Rep [uncultured virus]